MTGIIWFAAPLVAAAMELPADLTSPDQRVVCNRQRAICYDRMGPSIGLTAAFLGNDAAERLTYQLRAMPVDRRHGAAFSPAEGVACAREAGPRRMAGAIEITHSTMSACEPDPLELIFRRELAAAARYREIFRA
ncbi:MAG TPA: hypothetical protein VEI74_11570 [Candidatus Methylomirabilis sp.]|nr:hypothetical protein [Candidatus Methylomirabilis sp.]